MGLLRALRGEVLSDDELAAARAEGVEALVERARCALVYDDYRAPGKRFKGKKVMTSGGVLVTPTRVVVWAGGVRHLDLARDAVPTPSLAVRAEGDVLRLKWCAEKFHDDRSGAVSASLTTPEAERLAGLLG